jgi:hypothetical protein
LCTPLAQINAKKTLKPITRNGEEPIRNPNARNFLERNLFEPFAILLKHDRSSFDKTFIVLSRSSLIPVSTAEREETWTLLELFPERTE